MTAVATTQAAPAVLSKKMQDIARDYLEARKRAGAALLDQARYLSEARAAAKYGEWGMFLIATQTSEDWAGRLLNIHDTAEHDPRFADAIRSNFLNLSTAHELASAPTDLRDRLLVGPEPPTVKEIRDEKRDTKLRDVAEFEPPDFDAARDRVSALGWALSKHGIWWKLVGPDGSHYATAAPADILPTIERFEQTAARKAVEANVSMPSEAVPPPALPPLPSDLARDWTRWQNEDGTIGMATIYGFKLAGNDRQGLESEARRVKRELAELRDHDWRVFYDIAAEGRSDLHAYTATHQEFDAISASNIPHLALAAWYARAHEDWLPDMPSDVIDGLWLKGYDWSGTAWVRGSEVLRDLPLSELRYLAGVDAIPHLPPDFAICQKRAEKLGLVLSMNVHGIFTLLTSEGYGTTIYLWSDVLSQIAENEQLARAVVEAQVSHPDTAPALVAASDPRTLAIGLLQQLAPLMELIRTEDMSALAGAINDLNECEEGTEASAWLAVGWALLDVEGES